ncbi:hypothetical protein NEIELOOT_02253 [Neisseria elongata subsp. glycolytica ATCC 29315]|uniref:Uncharacterized protein n=1 Tax=Neisseria elongata subsp. glycolytica ATCC 29315 TaxID=546263 RepID=D4DT52_NEIEG|nr:hypothetical protein NEIELOOT_02253 [Neisseria elongata subsp. glycolytica ATCC 29315]
MIRFADYFNIKRATMAVNIRTRTHLTIRIRFKSGEGGETPSRFAANPPSGANHV